LQLPQLVSQPDQLQLPVAQLAPVACAGAQAVPQRPQLESVVSEVSQPSEAPPPQSPQPMVQETMLQVPELHDSLALARSQSRPQLPQLVSEVSEVSQPSAQPPLQLP
jgi:hypothetical protein